MAKGSSKTSKVKYIPHGDRVLIKPLNDADKETKLPSGIIIPETVSKEKTDRGKVIAVGEGRITEDGKKIPPRVKPGDVVIFQWGDKIEIEKEDYFVVSESNILLTLK